MLWTTEQRHRTVRQRRHVLDREHGTRPPVVEDAAEGFEIAGEYGRSRGHRLQQNDAEALATGVGRDEHVDRRQGPRLVGLVDHAEERDPIAHRRRHPLRRLLDIARTRYEQADARMVRSNARQRIQEDVQPLARFVDAPEKAERATRTRPPRHGRRGREAPDRHPVGDQHCIAAKMLDEGAARVLGHRDACTDLLQHRLQDRVRGAHGARPLHRGVERPHDRALGRPAGEHRQARRCGLVHVQHVELTLT